jgi:hypothetical protein
MISHSLDERHDTLFEPLHTHCAQLIEKTSLATCATEIVRIHNEVQGNCGLESGEQKKAPDILPPFPALKRYLFKTENFWRNSNVNQRPIEGDFLVRCQDMAVRAERSEISQTDEQLLLKSEIEPRFH